VLSKEEQAVKKIIMISLVIVLLAGLILSSCAEETAEPTPQQTTPQQEQPTEPSGHVSRYLAIEPKPVEKTERPEPEKVYKLRYSDWGPPFIDIGVRAQEWIAAIEERTEGRIHIDGYWSESLMKADDTFRGVEAGIADIALYVLGGSPGVHQINRVIDLPGTGIPTQAAQRDIYLKLRAKYPELDAEYGKAFPLFMRGLPAEHIHTTGKFHLVRTPDDLAGLKTYANALWTEQLDSKGASINNVAVMEQYTSLERGLIQGMFVHWLFIYSFGLTELMKYHAVVGEGGLGMQTFGYIMNRESYAQLPDDLKKIFMDTTDEWAELALTEDDPTTIAAGIALAEELGNEVAYLTDAEIAEWYEFAKPIHEQWIADSEAAGFTNARAIYDDMMQMIAEY
jgi:TRAP-type C4-dicarboxylate transport system substrate-binding protein